MCPPVAKVTYMSERSGAGSYGLPLLLTSEDLTCVLDFPLTPSPTTLTDLPVELIEHIAKEARDTVRFSDFPYSNVMNKESSVRSPKPACLFTGQPNRFYTKISIYTSLLRTANVMSLLLRTLDQRPDLGIYVRNISLDRCYELYIRNPEEIIPG